MKQAHLNRDHHARQALFKGLIISLVEHESVTTTAAKAKILESIFAKLLTGARIGTLASRRRVQAVVQQPHLVKKIVDDLAKRYETVKGGYTSRKPIGTRKGDNAPIVKVSLTKSKAHIPVSKSKSSQVASKPKSSKQIIKNKVVKPVQKLKSQPVSHSEGRIGFRQGER